MLSRRGRSLLPVLVLGLLLIGCTEPERSADVARAAEIAIANVTILSPAHGSARPGYTVLVAGDTIVAVGRRNELEPPADATVIDGSGRYLIPGLWDLHTHLTLADSAAAPLMVAQGVTGARDMGAVLAEIDTLRRRVASGRLLGPRIVYVGPTLNGERYGPFQRVIDGPEEARAAVEELAAHGVDLLKTHNATGRDAYFALLKAASEAGLTVAGHVPTEVSPLEACRAGQVSVEHIATIFEGTYLAEFPGEMEALQGMDEWLAEDAGRLIECLVERGTLFVPTLTTYEARARRAARYDDPDPRLKYLGVEGRERFLEAMEPTETDRNPRVIEARMRLVEVGQELTRRLHAAGGSVGVGTDLAHTGVLPGFTVHREIELLVEAGLPPHAALWASVRGPGVEAGADSLSGRIAAGAPADLVLLRADPFEDVRALSEIETVVLRGRLLDRTELDEVLASLAAEPVRGDREGG